MKTETVSQVGTIVPEKKKQVRRKAGVRVPSKMGVAATYDKQTPVDHIKSAFNRILDELSGGDNSMQLVCHQGDNEFIYTIVHQDAVLILQVHQLNEDANPLNLKS